MSECVISGNLSAERCVADEGTEWHRLVLREGQNIETLRRILCELLALFPQYDWQHEPRSAAVRRFEEKVQEAWWGPNGIAEFHD